MKRIFFLCCIITLFCNSCNDESEVFFEDSEDEIVELPTEDAIKERTDKTIYYIESISGNNERQIIDNFAVRFNVKKTLEPSSQLEPGDAVAFESKILNDIVGNDNRMNMLKNAYNQGAIIMMNGGNTDDFLGSAKH